MQPKFHLLRLPAVDTSSSALRHCSGVWGAITMYCEFPIFALVASFASDGNATSVMARAVRLSNTTRFIFDLQNVRGSSAFARPVLGWNASPPSGGNPPSDWRRIHP